MTLSELFAAIGDDNLKFQLVGNCMVGQQWNATKKHPYSRITLGTNEDFTSIMNGSRVGFLVFCDKAKLDEARKSPPTESEKQRGVSPLLTNNQK